MAAMSFLPGTALLAQSALAAALTNPSPCVELLIPSVMLSDVLCRALLSESVGSGTGSKAVEVASVASPRSRANFMLDGDGGWISGCNRRANYGGKNQL
jgi:hypothetical protein